MKKNDVFLMGNIPFLVVETMETESGEQYAMILNLTDWRQIEIIKIENNEDGYKIQKVANDYLATKLRSNFNEKLKSSLLTKYNIKIVDDEK